MAFGVSKKELAMWKSRVTAGNIALFTHYWFDPRFPEYRTVTKAGCADINNLVKWGAKYGLEAHWVDRRNHIPHFDLMGKKQLEILQAERCFEQISKFRLEEDI